MYRRLFKDFLKSSDTLRVYDNGNLLFASDKDGLLPLLEYNTRFPPHRVTVFDKIMGNAAALLAVRAGCCEVYSPLGSELAIATLDNYCVRHHLSRVVTFIQKVGGEEMCPMEKLSIGKAPEEFYRALAKLIQAVEK